MADEQVEETGEAPKLREELTVRISVMSRALRLDEVGFACFSGGDTEWPAVVLTDYAEVNTETGVVGGNAGDYVVDGPNGIEVLTAVGFGQKFTFEADATPNEAPVDDGFVQDLDAARQDEDPATAEKGTGEAGDTPGDFTGSPTNPLPEVEGSEEDEVEPGTALDEPKAEADEEGDGTEVGGDDEAPSDGTEPSQFEALNDGELLAVAVSLEIEFEGDVVVDAIERSALIALIDAAVAEAENAPGEEE